MTLSEELLESLGDAGGKRGGRPQVSAGTQKGVVYVPGGKERKPWPMGGGFKVAGFGIHIRRKFLGVKEEMPQRPPSSLSLETGNLSQWALEGIQALEGTGFWDPIPSNSRTLAPQRMGLNWLSSASLLGL